MKPLLTLLAMLLLGCVLPAVNTIEQEFLCPVCGTRWKQAVETSGQARGLRLDLRQTGDVVDPPSLPQCTKCRFPLFSDQILAQAGDPAKEQAFKRLRGFVLGPDFQMLSAKNPPYFALAQVQQILGAPHRTIGLSYLRASWQVEDKEAVCRRMLEKALASYLLALEGAAPDSRERSNLALICGEIERRLGKWEEAEKRFRELQSSTLLKGTPAEVVPALQLHLISKHVSAPHMLDGASVAKPRGE